MQSRPLYVVVHPPCYDLALKVWYRSPSILYSFLRFKRILKNEQHILQLDYSREIPKGLDDCLKLPHQKILVCGCWLEHCVDEQLAALRKNGYNAHLYVPASIARSTIERAA